MLEVYLTARRRLDGLKYFTEMGDQQRNSGMSIMAIAWVFGLFMIKTALLYVWGGAVCVINNKVDFNRVLNVCISAKITTMSWQNHDKVSLENDLQLCTVLLPVPVAVLPTNTNFLHNTSSI